MAMRLTQPDLSYVGDERPDPEWHLKHFRDPQSVSPSQSIQILHAVRDPQWLPLTRGVSRRS
jgi:cbb3-type cytochrome oxidase cytochrome c subunit